MEDILYRRMTIEDAQTLTNMYKSIEINKTNYKDKLSDSETFFGKHGGMFVINDYNKNAEVLSSKDDVIIGCEYDGKSCGMIWYNVKDTEYPYDKIAYTQEGLEYKKILDRALDAGKVFTGKEVIVLQGSRRGMAYKLFQIMLQKSYDAGMDYMNGEVYHVDGYEDDEGFHKVDILNMPSFITIKNTGAMYLGTAPQRKISKEGITYYITPHVFLWDLKETPNVIQNKIDSIEKQIAEGRK